MMATEGCCPTGSWGAASLSKHIPTGQYETIISSNEDGKISKEIQPMLCYCAGTPLNGDVKRVVLIFADVYGIESGNHKAIADFLGEELNKVTKNGDSQSNTAVLLPDLFRGYPAVTPISFLPSFINRYMVVPQIIYGCRTRLTTASLEEDFIKFIFPWLEAKIGKKVSEFGVSAIGFCYGGWQVARMLRLANMGMLVAKCGVGIHPSLNVERIHGGSEEDLAASVGAMPFLLLPASNDYLKPGQHRAVSILARAQNIQEEEVAVEFPSMVHGWVPRGNSTDPDVAENQ